MNGGEGGRIPDFENEANGVSQSTLKGFPLYSGLAGPVQENIFPFMTKITFTFQLNINYRFYHFRLD